MTEENPTLPSEQAAPAPIAPLDVDGVAAITYGTIAWAIATVLCVVFRAQLADSGRGWWLWVAVVGLALGLIGMVWLRRRAAFYRARAAAGPSA